MSKQIEKYIDKTIYKYTSELRKQGLIKNNRHTPFQKTELLLYNYHNFKEAIKDKEEQIREIECFGIRKRSPSITSIPSSDTYEIKSDIDKAEEKIETIEQSIQMTRNFIRTIDSALDMIKDDQYFEIIRMKYFEGNTREEMSLHFEVDVSTISRNKNRLINLLQIRLFSDEVIHQIFS